MRGWVVGWGRWLRGRGDSTVIMDDLARWVGVHLGSLGGSPTARQYGAALDGTGEWRHVALPQAGMW
jgi:hypothetical protein